jgi:RecB family exonuclease
VEAVAHELLRLRVQEDVAWSEMAVILRRYGNYLTALRHALNRHGIPYVVVAEQAALGTEQAVRPLIDLLRFVFQEERREQLLEPILSSPIVGLDPTALRRLRREARTAGLTVLELVEGGAGPSLSPELQAPVDRLRSLLRDIPELVARHGPDGLFFELWRRLPHFAELVASDDPRRRRDVEALTAFAEVLSRFAERRPGSGVEDYLETLEAAEFGPDPWIPPEERRPDAVRVLSAHLAQGLEFEAVMVAGCLEGEFPSLSHTYPLVSLDPLVAPRTPPERIGDRLAEERALFRLAVSRARRKTVLLASASTGARTPRSPSRFATRLGLRWSLPAEQAPPATSLRSMEGELRRRLSDRAGEAADRLAGAAALARVGARPEAWWAWREWTRPDEPLYPLEEPIRTSYSRLSTLENCALQYLYSVELGLDPDQSYQMWLGSLVHDIIDRVQRGELGRDLEAIFGALDERWRPEVFPNRAIEHRRYQDARDMLVRWFHHEQAEPELSEVWFEFPLDGGVIRGRIDAVFRMNNGHVRVVDYKTSRFPISDREAKEDLQLAAYYLALRRTPELEPLGEPGYLQLAYLGKGHQQTGFVRRDVSPKTVRPDYEAWAEERIRDLLQRIREEAFAPNPEANCDFCRFKPICPRWPEGGEVLKVPAAQGGEEAPGL